MSTAQTSTSVHRNPWLVALPVVASPFLLLGLILMANKSESSSRLEDAGLSTGQIVGAGLLGLAGTLLVAWLVCAAIAWHLDNARDHRAGADPL